MKTVSQHGSVKRGSRRAVGPDNIYSLLKEFSTSESDTFRDINKRMAYECNECKKIFCGQCASMLPARSEEEVRLTMAKCPMCEEGRIFEPLMQWP